MSDSPVSFSPVPRWRLVELAARWYVFWFLNVYGVAKLIGGQFYRRGHLPPDVSRMTLGDAGAFELAWTFMGYSFAYMAFIAVAEILGAWLLLWERTKLIGVFTLLPVMINIIVFDIVFLDKYGALASATIYTILLFVILWCNRERAVAALQALTRPRGGVRAPGRERVKAAILALLLAGALFAADQALVNFFGHGKG